MEKFLLIAHLTGAFYLLFIISKAIWYIFSVHSSIESLNKVSGRIGFVSFIQVFSGSLLALQASNFSVASYCSRIGIYITVLILVELLLIFKIGKMMGSSRGSVNQFSIILTASLLVVVFTVGGLYFTN